MAHQYTAFSSLAALLEGAKKKRKYKQPKLIPAWEEPKSVWVYVRMCGRMCVRTSARACVCLFSLCYCYRLDYMHAFVNLQ